MLLARVSYRKGRWKFARKDEDERFLEVFEGKSISNLKPTGNLILYSFDRMLSPVKPSKLIMYDTSMKAVGVKFSTCTVSPSANVLLPKGASRAFFNVHLAMVIGEESIFGYSLFLNVFTDHFGDVRDVVHDTFAPFSEFISTQAIPKSVELEVSGKRISIENRIEEGFLNELFRQAISSFTFYVGDVVSVCISDTFEIHEGDGIAMHSCVGRVETKVSVRS